MINWSRGRALLAAEGRLRLPARATQGPQAALARHLHPRPPARHRDRVRLEITSRSWFTYVSRLGFHMISARFDLSRRALLYINRYDLRQASGPTQSIPRALQPLSPLMVDGGHFYIYWLLRCHLPNMAGRWRDAGALAGVQGRGTARPRERGVDRLVRLEVAADIVSRRG